VPTLAGCDRANTKSHGALSRPVRCLTNVAFDSHSRASTERSKLRNAVACSVGVVGDERLVRASDGDEDRVPANCYNAGRTNSGRTRCESVVANDLPHLRHSNAIIRRELDGRNALLETDVRIKNAFDPFQSPAHGVGANRSVHPKDRLSHFLKLSTCNSRDDGERGDEYEPFHSLISS